MAGGRPEEYTPELSDIICERLAAGESMRSISQDDNMPCRATMFSWMRKHEEFLNQYARAKEESADAFVEEILDIADDGSNDWMERKDAEGEIIGWQLNGEHVQRSKLRVDTRKWAASKLKPKKYGDKIDHTHAGGDKPVHMILTEMTAEQATAEYKGLIDD